MKTMLLAALLAVSFAAPTYASVLSDNSQEVVSAKKGKGKSEPAPKDRDEREGGGDEVDPRQETYEGNDRGGGGGSFDGGGYNDGGGMAGEIFSVPQSKTYPVTTNTKVEDRGDVVIYTTVVQEDVSSEETCTTVSVLVVEKATGKKLSSESKESCSHLPL